MSTPCKPLTCGLDRSLGRMFTVSQRTGYWVTEVSFRATTKDVPSVIRRKETSTNRPCPHLYEASMLWQEAKQAAKRTSANISQNYLLRKFQFASRPGDVEARLQERHEPEHARVL